MADAGDDGLGDELTDQQARHDHDRAGGDDRREDEVQRLGHGLLRAQAVGSQFVEAAGDDDGVIDVRAHLDGHDDQIAVEEDIAAHEPRDGEVDADAALDDQNEQDRHAERAEREEQDEHDEEQTRERDDEVVLLEGFLEVIGVRGVADRDDLVRRVILLGNHVHAVDEVEGLLTLDGELELEDEAAVVLALQLVARHGKLIVEIADEGELLLAHLKVAGLGLVVQEEEEVDDRHAVFLRRLGDGAGRAVQAAVIGKEALRHGLVHARERGELLEVYGVAELVAAHGVDRGETHDAVHLVEGGKVRQQRLFAVEIARRHEHGEGVVVAEARLDLAVGHLMGVLLGRDEKVLAVGEVHLLIEIERAGEDEHEQDRDDLARRPREAADEGNLRHELAVARLVHGLAEDHEKPRHDEEDA